MLQTLDRTIIDKVGSLLFFIILSTILYFNFLSFSLIENIIFIPLSIISFINLIFILFTPIAKIDDSNLFLYSEIQPILYDVKPQIINLSEVESLMISEKIVYNIAIFRLNNGKTIYHSFPSKRRARVLKFLWFINENTNIAFVK